MRLCSVSIDLDEIACYASIHGLSSAPECHAVYDLALTRILDFATSLALPLTLFVITRDLDRGQNLTMLRRAVSNGHEIGNHSLDHLYDLTRRERSEQIRQVVEASSQIQALLGVRPEGFRAPGYTVSDSLMAVLGEAGFSYDSAMARALIARGADIRARNRRGAEPLHAAVIGNPNSPTWNPADQCQIIELLVASGADPNATAAGGVTPLHRAVRNRCSAAVETLLRAGANPRLPNDSGSTAADLAASTTGRGGSGSAEAKAEQRIILDVLDVSLD